MFHAEVECRYCTKETAGDFNNPSHPAVRKVAFHPGRATSLSRAGMIGASSRLLPAKLLETTLYNMEGGWVT